MHIYGTLYLWIPSALPQPTYLTGSVLRKPWLPCFLQQIQHTLHEACFFWFALTLWETGSIWSCSEEMFACLRLQLPWIWSTPLKYIVPSGLLLVLHLAHLSSVCFPTAFEPLLQCPLFRDIFSIQTKQDSSNYLFVQLYLCSKHLSQAILI